MDPAPDPQPIPGPAPQPDIPLPLAIVAPGADEKKEKRDGFYKSWDRFTKKKRLLSIIPSLDHDPEGRPGHGVRRNTEGVVSRYVLCLALTLSLEATCLPHLSETFMLTPDEPESMLPRRSNKQKPRAKPKSMPLSARAAVKTKSTTTDDSTSQIQIP